MILFLHSRPDKIKIFDSVNELKRLAVFLWLLFIANKLNNLVNFGRIEGSNHDEGKIRNEKEVI